MNAHNRNYFTDLLPCCRCGREPMRVYCDATGNESMAIISQERVIRQDVQM